LQLLSIGIQESVFIQFRYKLRKDYFDIEYRRKILAENIGEVDMYLIKEIKD
jgi:hypothetical protein